jgi:cytoskeletal protein RodZ
LGEFGEKLRKQREQRGIALENISNTTKISTRMLRALEEENFDQLPGGVFNKGFVRAYARQVGLDEEEAIADYLAALRESQVQSQKILPDLRATKSAGPAPGASHHRTLERTGDKTRVFEEPGSSEVASYNHQREETGGKDFRQNEPGRGAASTVENGHSTEDRRKFDRRSEDRRHQERRDEHHGGAWQVQDRRASDFLSQAEPGENEQVRGGSDSTVPTFATGTYGEARPDRDSGAPWGKLAVALVIICALVVLWKVHERRQLALSASTSNSAESPSTGAASGSAASEPPDSGARLGNNVALPAAAKSSVKSSAATARTAGTYTSAPSSMAVTHSASASPVTTAATGSAATAAAPSKSSSEVKAPAFTVVIRAEKTSWISVNADGKTVVEETLIAPAEISVRASSEIVVRAGNAAGVSFILNSKEIPAQGTDGEVRTYTFDASGMKLTTSNPAPKLTNN